MKSIKSIKSIQSIKLINSTKSIKGFSLIELMIVVGIITILGMLAIPSYQDYVIRAKVVNILAMAQPAKLSVSEAIIAGQTATVEPMLDQDSIKEMVVAKNIITITANSEKLGITPKEKVLKIILTPTSNAQQMIHWKCTTEPNDLKKYVPAECR